MLPKQSSRLIRFKGAVYRLVSADGRADPGAYMDRLLLKEQGELSRAQELAREKRRREEVGQIFLPSRSKREPRKWKTVPPKEPVSVKQYPENKRIRLFSSDVDLFMNNAPDAYEKFKHLFPKSDEAVVWMSLDEMSGMLDALYTMMDVVSVGSDEFRRITTLVMELERLGATVIDRSQGQRPGPLPSGIRPSVRDQWEPGKPLPQTLYLRHHGAVYRRVR